MMPKRRIGSSAVLFVLVIVAMLVIGVSIQSVQTSPSTVGKDTVGAPAMPSGQTTQFNGNQSNSNPCAALTNLGQVAGLQGIGPQNNITCSSQGSQTGSGQQSRNPGLDPDWAIGAYSSDTGISAETTTWENLPSSFTMTGVTSANFIVNTPFTVGGTFSCGSNMFTLAGFLFQGSTQYKPSGYGYAYPDVTIIMITSTGAGAYYDADWSTNLGSGAITETIQYETYNSITGWWLELTSGATNYYLMSISSTNGIDFNVAPAATANPCQTSGLGGAYSASISSVGTTSSAVTGKNSGGTTITWDPSIAMEVDEATSGNFFTDNSNLGMEAVVTSSEFYHYATTFTDDFNIGADASPSNAYSSGLTDKVSGVTGYYDELGTSTGIPSRYSSHWSLWTPQDTQTTTTNLPSLNDICSGSGCTGSYTLTMHTAGTGTGTVSPSTGSQTAGAQVTITGTPGMGCNSFEYWVGSGYGSYSGYNNPSTVTMDGNSVTETAYFINACIIH